MKNKKRVGTRSRRGRLDMVMDRIGGLSNLGKGILDRFQGSDRAGASEGSPVRKENAPVQDDRTPPADKADISPKAHRLMDLSHAMDSGRQALEDLPEVRQDRLAEVRARLGRGYYNSLEVRARVAERLNDVARTLEEL